MKEFCPVHECNKGTSRCICDPPYVLIPFPTERKDPERRVAWIKLMNRKNIKTGKNWAPDKNSRVCSMHFADGAPSRSFPNPTLNLGYPVPSTSTGKKRAPPKPRTPVTVRASKRQKLNIQSPSTEDAQNRGTSKEDTPKTSGSDPGNDPGTDA
uniref:THAP-type domain-containing protein n=1 Tax=Knipowitschia caucasica TaxID=637954 RepID=A0AAV2LP33_KNICA